MKLLDRDFRCDVTPASARRRLEHFSTMLAAVEAKAELDAMAGVARDSSSPEYEFRRLLRAQIDFARAQIECASVKANETAGPSQ